MEKEFKAKGLFRLDGEPVKDKEPVADDVKWESGKLTVKGMVILNTGQIFKVVDGKFVEDDGSGETAFD